MSVSDFSTKVSWKDKRSREWVDRYSPQKNPLVNGFTSMGRGILHWCLFICIVPVSSQRMIVADNNFLQFSCGTFSDCVLSLREMLTRARWSIQDDTFGGFYTHFLVILWMCERQLHWLLEDHNIATQSASILAECFFRFIINILPHVWCRIEISSQSEAFISDLFVNRASSVLKF